MILPFTLDQLVGSSSGDIIDQAFIDAKEKQRRIIAREGDAGGRRLEPEYFDQLFIEEIWAMMSTQQLWSKYQNKRKNSAQTDNHTLLSLVGLT